MCAFIKLWTVKKINFVCQIPFSWQYALSFYCMVLLATLTGRSLGSDQCMIHHTMNDILINVYPSLHIDLESIILLLTFILLALIVTAKLVFFALTCNWWHWQATRWVIKHNNSNHMFFMCTFLILYALCEYFAVKIASKALSTTTIISDFSDTCMNSHSV